MVNQDDRGVSDAFSNSFCPAILFSWFLKTVVRRSSAAPQWNARNNHVQRQRRLDVCRHFNTRFEISSCTYHVCRVFQGPCTSLDTSPHTRRLFRLEVSRHYKRIQQPVKPIRQYLTVASKSILISLSDVNWIGLILLTEWRLVTPQVGTEKWDTVYQPVSTRQETVEIFLEEDNDLADLEAMASAGTGKRRPRVRVDLAGAEFFSMEEVAAEFQPEAGSASEASSRTQLGYRTTEEVTCFGVFLRTLGSHGRLAAAVAVFALWSCV